jgi:hypothetical protein
MRHYFFDVTNGNTLADEVGDEFELVHAARGHAVAVARELSRHQLPLALVGHFILIIDEGGVVIFKMPL